MRALRVRGVRCPPRCRARASALCHAASCLSLIQRPSGCPAYCAGWPLGGALSRRLGRLFLRPPRPPPLCAPVVGALFVGCALCLRPPSGRIGFFVRILCASGDNCHLIIGRPIMTIIVFARRLHSLLSSFFPDLIKVSNAAAGGVPPVPPLVFMGGRSPPFPLLASFAWLLPGLRWWGLPPPAGGGLGALPPAAVSYGGYSFRSCG